MATEISAEEHKLIKAERKLDDSKLSRHIENISSIREALNGCRHETLCYPACGTDVLRVILAYQPSEAYFIDHEGEYFQKIMGQFNEIGIEIVESSKDDDELYSK